MLRRTRPYFSWAKQGGVSPSASAVSSASRSASADQLLTPQLAKLPRSISACASRTTWAMSMSPKKSPTTTVSKLSTSVAPESPEAPARIRSSETSICSAKPVCGYSHSQSLPQSR